MAPDRFRFGSETEAEQQAHEVLRIATDQAAAQRATIASIEERIHVVTVTVVAQPQAHMSISPTMPVPEDDDGDLEAAADAFERSVEDMATREHQRRMRTRYRNNRQIRIDNAPANIGGYHGRDGTFMANRVVQDSTDGQNIRIFKHEWDGHQAVGLPSGDLDRQIVDDAELAQAIEEELHQQAHSITQETNDQIQQTLDHDSTSPDAVIEDVAQQVVMITGGADQTIRDAEETWAVSQEGVAPSGPYVPMHLQPMDALHQETTTASGSYDIAFHALIHNKDNTQMVQLVARAKLEKVGLSPAAVTSQPTVETPLVSSDPS